MPEPLTTVQTHVQYLLMYPDPDGDWVVYGRAQQEQDALDGVRDLRERTSFKWQVVRQIVTQEVLDA